MDTEEMYRRGVSDAEQGTLHPFYYQHYYHYRRGYDQARRRLRRPAPWRQGGAGRRLIFAVLILTLGVAGFAVWRARSHPATLAQPLPTALPAAARVTPTREPLFPTATPVPTEVPLVLQVGGMAVVSNVQGTVLNGRQEPRRDAPRIVQFQQDEQVRILEGPVEADGFIWWRIEGQSGSGWSAERSPEGVVWLQPIKAP